MRSQPQPQESELAAFYLGRAPHPGGMTIDQAWALTDGELDAGDAVIAWLFPINRGDTSRSPVVSSHEIEAFARDPELRRRLMKSFTRMLSYYGFDIRTSTAGLRVTPAADFVERSRRWMFPRSPHYKRITRILESVSRLGLREAARPFLRALRSVYAANQGTVGNTTLVYWTEAVEQE
jgi:hypothetical protein